LEYHQSFLALETLSFQKRDQIAGIARDNGYILYGGVRERVRYELRAQPLALMIGMHQNIPDRPPKDEIGKHPAKRHELGVMPHRKTEIRAAQHPFYLFERPASAPMGKPVKIPQITRLYGKLAVVKDILLRLIHIIRHSYYRKPPRKS
jgi:hypothetical protein